MTEREAIVAITDFVRHDRLCGVVGGYDRCTCGMEEALFKFEKALDHLSKPEQD